MNLYFINGVWLYGKDMTSPETMNISVSDYPYGTSVDVIYDCYGALTLAEVVYVSQLSSL